MLLSGAPLRTVEAYIWRIGGSLDDIVIPALDYWDGSIVEIEGKRYIIVPEPYNQYSEPDEERLACGHEQPLRIGRRCGGTGKIYNRRRRCIACALEQMAV
jgi:hypothetical protein